MRHCTPIFHSLSALILVIGLTLLPRLTHAQYTPDILGNGYEQRTFHMGQDAEGEVVCTLVKRSFEAQAKTAVLYVHGYNDYFFQKELGDSIATWAIASMRSTCASMAALCARTKMLFTARVYGSILPI